MDSYDPPESIGTKEVQTYLVWRHSDVMSKTQKSPKIAKIMVFRYFFKQKLHFLAMMCVKVCLHMFLLQINQINKIKHSESVSWKQKMWFVCNFHWKSVFGQFFVGPSALLPRHYPKSDFCKNGFKFSARLKKNHEVSARINDNRLRYNKKCRGGRIPSPGSFRVNGLPRYEMDPSLEQGN